MMKPDQDSVRTLDVFGNEHWRNADGKRHRLDGPAIVWANGTREWWVDGKLHRLDGPAYVDVDRSMEWWIDGERVDMELYGDGGESVLSNVRIER